MSELSSMIKLIKLISTFTFPFATFIPLDFVKTFTSLTQLSIT